MRRNWQFRSQERAFLRRQGTELKHADRLVQPCQQKTYRGEHSPARQNSSFTILTKWTKLCFVYLHFLKCKYDQGESPRKSKKCENIYLFCCQGKNSRSSHPRNFLSIKKLSLPRVWLSVYFSGRAMTTLRSLWSICFVLWAHTRASRPVKMTSSCLRTCQAEFQHLTFSFCAIGRRASSTWSATARMESLSMAFSIKRRCQMAIRSSWKKGRARTSIDQYIPSPIRALVNEFTRNGLATIQPPLAKATSSIFNFSRVYSEHGRYLIIKARKRLIEFKAWGGFVISRGFEQHIYFWLSTCPTSIMTRPRGMSPSSGDELFFSPLLAFRF